MQFFNEISVKSDSFTVVRRFHLPRDDKHKEIIKEYDLAIDSCPKTKKNDKFTLCQNRAAAYDYLQKWSLVIDDCSVALAMDPKYLKALKRRAKAYELQRELAKSLEDITAACILEDFKNKSTLVLANRVLNKLSQQHVEKANKEKREDQPCNFFVKMYYVDKSDAFTRRYDLHDESMGCKGIMILGSYDGIITAYTEKIETSKTESENKMEILLVRTTFYLQTAQYAETSADLDVIIGSKVADYLYRSYALILRAKLAMQTQPNTPEEWFRFLNEAERVYPDNYDIYFHRGLAYMRTERVSEAISDFEKACSLCSRNGAFQIHKWGATYRQALINKDEYALRKVIDGFCNAIKQAPICVYSYTHMAEVLFDLQKFQKASNITGLIESFLRHVENRGVFLMQENAAIMRALQVDDKCPYAYEALGMVQVQQGQLQGAIVLFNTAIKMANAEAELTRLYKLKNAVVAQLNVTKNMGLNTKIRILDFLLVDIFTEV